MIGNGNIFSGGKKSSRNKLNRLRSDTTAAGNMRGDNLIHVMSNNNGYSFTFDVQKLISLLPLRIGGSGSTLLKAYCKEDAGDSNSITCLLSYPELNVQSWVSTATYGADNIVIYNNKYWLSKVSDNLNHTPAEDSYWTEITEYNEASTYNITNAKWTLYDDKLWRSLQAGNIGHLPIEGSWWSTKAPAYTGAAYIDNDRVTKDGKVCFYQKGNWVEIEEIEVYCNIAGGNSLQYAFPLLAEQQEIIVEYNNSTARYEAIQLFQACEVTCAAGGMLELVNEMLVTDIASSNSGVWVDGQAGGIGLRFSAYAQSTYIIEFSILYTAANAAGIVLGVDATDTSGQLTDKLSVSGVFYGQSGTLVGKTFNDYYDTDTCTLTGETGGAINYVRGECVFQTFETPGEFVLKFRTASNGNAVTLKIGSNIKYRRIYRASTWPAWQDDPVSYTLNEKVSYGGKTWKSLEYDNVGNTPAEDEHWTEVAG